METTVTTKQLVPNDSLDISLDSPLVIDSRLAADFANPVYRLTLDKDKIQIYDEKSSTNFPELTAARGDETTNLAASPESVLTQLTEKEGKRVSNIGVSLALTTTIAGEPYAVMVHRKHDDRLMLLSGYVNAQRANPDISTRGLFAANALGEHKEEFLPVSQNGLVDTGAVLGQMAAQIAKELVIGTDDFKFKRTDELGSRSKLVGVSLGQGYESLSYNKEPHFSLQWADSMPSFLPNVHHVGDIIIDGKPLTAGMQYAQQWNAGQLFVPMHLTLSDTTGMNIYHAEDKFDLSTKKHLVTMLDRTGIVFVKLDSNGDLMTDMYNLHNGKLVAVESENAEERKLSEAFSPSPITGVTGFVNQSDVQFKDRVKATKS